jgi:F-type H+-transporting ATPase subunit delta
MSELSTLARPYAVAVFKHAIETDSAEKWSEMLNFLSAVVADKQLSDIIESPKVTRTRLIQLLVDICQGQFTDQGNNLIKLLVQNQRLNLVPSIASQYEEYKAEHEGYIDVDVISAFSFTKTEEKTFASTLGKKLKKTVNIKVRVDKSLIGGVVVRAGDTVIDGSIKGQLQQLAKQL